MRKPFTMIAVGIFTFVALAHLCRLYEGWAIQIGSTTIPMWASIPGAIVPGALAYLIWHENKASSA